MGADVVVTGRSLPKDRFTVREVDGRIDGEVIASLLAGDIAAGVFRNAVPQTVCQQLVSNFWKNSGRRERPDGVPGHFIGAYHFGKETAAYFRDVSSTRPYLDELYRGVADPAEAVREEARRALARRGGSFRAAKHGGLSAGGSRALCWTASGKYLLDPHDDMAQLGQPQQGSFEIQKVRQHTVVAVNIYPHVHPLSGRYVQIWNIQPDDDCRRLLGLEHSGYPYPAEPLEAIESMLIEVNTGDICLFNGAQIHAVLGESDDVPLRDRRLLITFFMGFIDEATAVWWT